MSDDKRDDKDLSQLDKFKATAIELECDDDEVRFRDRLGKIAKSDNKVPEKTKPWG